MMMRTTVVNVRRETCDAYIGRGPGGRIPTTPGARGYFGNPMKLEFEAQRDEVIERYRKYFEARVASDPVFRAEVLKLKSKRLGCWCPPRGCHGDVIVAWLENDDSE